VRPKSSPIVVLCQATSFHHPSTKHCEKYYVPGAQINKLMFGVYDETYFEGKFKNDIVLNPEIMYIKALYSF